MTNPSIPAPDVVGADTPRVAANVTREKLPNGLTLLIKENHTAPVVALLVLVKAGYFHEPDRVQGIAHVIEHMLFKGTPKRPGVEQFAQEIRELGGVLNASTYYEETAYYVVVPSAHFEAALEVQADAVRNPQFDAGELAKEIEVIIQESLRKRDNPSAMLIESLYELAYDRHRIRRWRIGEDATLRAMRRDDLLDFVHTMYRPENITFAIVGDVNTETARDLAARYWGDLPTGEFRRDDGPAEPLRAGFRYRRATGDTRQKLAAFAFPTPPTLHPDAAALTILSGLLSDGRSARLYRRLKEDLQIANSAWAGYEGFEAFGVFTLGAEAIGDDPLPVERALWEEIGRIQREGVETDELERVKTRIESRRLYAQEEVLGVARTLAAYEALGDYRLTDVLLDRLRAVTARDVQRVAGAYFDLSQAALMEYLPQGSELPAEPTAEQVEALLRAVKSDTPAPLAAGDSIEPVAPVGEPSPTVRTPIASASDSDLPTRIDLPHGGVLLHKRRRDLPIVAINVLFPGGKRRETRANCGITSLMTKASLKGTRSFTAEEIANRIERLGSGIGLSVTLDAFGYGLKITRNALPEGFALLAEVMAAPTFPDDEVEREKQTIYAELRRQQDNGFGVAYDLFAAAYYDDHPYGLPSVGIAEAVAALTPNDLRAWHRANLSRGQMRIGVVGDLDADEATALVADLLPVSNNAVDSRSQPFTPLAPGENVVTRQKQQSSVVLGFAGADLYNEDRYALDVLAEVTAGMSGRFFRSVRGENALAYQVTGFHRTRREAGNFIAYVSTAPENEAQATELLLSECVRLSRELVGDDELNSTKASMVGEYVIGLQSFGAQAGELSSLAVYEQPLDEPQQYLARIQAVTPEQIRDVAARYLSPDRCWRGIQRGGGSTD